MEALKVICLIIANNARYQSSQQKLLYVNESTSGLFSFFKRRKITDSTILRGAIDSSKKFRKSILYYTAYILVSFLSVSASFGFTLQVVNKTSTNTLYATNEDTTAIYKQTLDNIDVQLAENHKAIVDYNKYIDTLNIRDVRFAEKRASYQNNIDDIQLKITKLLESKLDINTKIQDSKLKDIQIVKSVDKTMYTLMGETLKIPDKTIMFILLYLLSVLIEVGIFITSPHFEDKENSFIPAKEKPPVDKENIPVREKTTRKVKIVEKPKEEPRTLMTDDDIEVDYDDMVVEEPVAIVPFTQEAADKLLAIGKEDVSIVEAPKEEEVPIRVPRHPTNFERFIDSLFTNKGNTYLKDRDEAATEVGINKADATKYFNYLMQTKGNTGYTLIEFRREFNNWYPNYTSEYVKSYVTENYKGE